MYRTLQTYNEILVYNKNIKKIVNAKLHNKAVQQVSISYVF